MDEESPLLSREMKEKISIAINEYLDETYPTGTKILINDAKAKISQHVSGIIEGFVGPTNVPVVLVDFYDDGTFEIVLTEWPEKGLLN